jgi:site-specific recombinase XerD
MSLLAQIKKSKGKKPANKILNTTEKPNVISSDEEDLSEDESFNSEDSFKSVTASAKRRWENTHDHTLHPADHQGDYYDINRNSENDENNMSYDLCDSGKAMGLDTIARYGNEFTTVKTSKKHLRTMDLPEIMSDMKTAKMSDMKKMPDMNVRYENVLSDMNGKYSPVSNNYRTKKDLNVRYEENGPIASPIGKNGSIASPIGKNGSIESPISNNTVNNNLASAFDKVMEWDAAIDTWAMEHNSEQTRKAYKFAGIHFKRWNKTRKDGVIAVPAQLTKTMAFEFKHYISGKELSQNSKRTFVSAWKSFLTWLFDEKITKENFGLKLKTVKCASNLEKDNEYVITRKEWIELINKSKSWKKIKEPLIVFLVLGFRFGIRVTAFLSLQRKALHFDDNKMYTKGIRFTYIDKGEQEFVRWLQPKDFHLLPDGWLECVRNMQPHEYLFPGKRVGCLTARKTLSRWLKTIGIECNIGIEKNSNGDVVCVIHPHSLRHAGAMHIAKRGDIVKVQDFLGHANLETVRWYLHSSKDEDEYNSEEEEEQPTRITSMNWQRTERNRRTNRQVEVPQEVPSQREYVEAYLDRAKEKYGTLKFREEGFGRAMVEKALRKYKKKYKNVAI